MSRYEVTEARQYVRDDGLTASIFGACPWTTEAERNRWVVRVVGWTIYDYKTGRTGIGQKPWRTRAEAEAWITEHS